MVDLSIIIVSYNTCDLTRDCLESLVGSLSQSPAVSCEVIIVDNASKDESVQMIKSFVSKTSASNTNVKFKTIFNTDNLGFSRANNAGLAQAEGKYILFLNSDVLIKEVNFADLVYYLNKNASVGILTVRVQLPSGKIDAASHRGFPTLWNSFTYFTRLEKVFSRIPKIRRFFGGYHMTHLDLNTIHEIDSPSGAFYLTRKKIMDEVGGFDTRFFMYGEDLDLSYRIKKRGFKAIYYPLFHVLHLKYKSGMRRGTKKTEHATKSHFYDSMKIFYDKHSGSNNGSLKSKLVHFFINLKSKL